MARYDAEHKGETRQRIIETAGRRFKQDGIDGSGIAVLMSDAGLTNGAFYAHFKSKDDLVANVVADQLRAQHATLSSLPRPRSTGGIRARLPLAAAPGPAGHGCPSAALLDEIGRCDDATRRFLHRGMQAIVDVIATHLTPDDPSDRSRQGARAVHGPGRHSATRPRRFRSQTVRRRTRIGHPQRTDPAGPGWLFLALLLGRSAPVCVPTITKLH